MVDCPYGPTGLLIGGSDVWVVCSFEKNNDYEDKELLLLGMKTPELKLNFFPATP